MTLLTRISKVGCNWKARAKRANTGEWILTMMNDKHNGHGRSESATQHPSLRQLPLEAMEEAKEMFQVGKSPKEVLEHLQGKWNPDVTAQDVYNLKAKIARMATKHHAEGHDSQAQRPAANEQQYGPPTDPRLLEHDHAVRENLSNQKPRCQCTCCEH